MNFAVSNIAWPAELQNDAYALLAESGITGLEVAPGLLFAGCDDPVAPSDAELRHAGVAYQGFGLEIVSMQSLLFGVQGAALFDGADSLRIFNAAMRRVITLAGRLGVPNLVFGSPRQRCFSESLGAEAAWSAALEIFWQLGEVAAAAGTRIAIEPNARHYGTNFLNQTDEALAFVKAVNHPAIVLNFDLGTAHMEGEFARIEALVADCVNYVGHVHISEPLLAPAPADSAQMAIVLRAFQNSVYAGWYSIEMGATDQPLVDLKRSIERLRSAEMLLNMVDGL